VDPVTRYFELHEQIQLAKRNRDYPSAAAHAKASIPLFASLARTKRDFGRWNIHSSVAVSEGAPVLMALGDHEGLRAMHTALADVPELAEWASEVADRAAMAVTGDRLVTLLQAGSSTQVAAMVALGVQDGRTFSNLCSWLAKVGRIERKRQGKTFELRRRGA
jgi:hypothetical protein